MGEIKFGTGGLRGKMMPGPEGINNETIKRVTQGLANYIKKQPEEEWKNGVAICHDSRIHSREFAEESAAVLAGNGIRVHLVKDLRPTPFVSFAVRYLKCIAGINITASHNPKEYNGYKVYWADGGQVVPPHDLEIIQEVEKVTDIKSEKNSLVSTISEEVERAYLQAVYDLCPDPSFDQKHGYELQIIYSPLNGAGMTMVPEALKMWGFPKLEVVAEQKKPDGNFPTTPYPNPEFDAALELGWRDLLAKQADILLVTDPDSDRLSCSLLINNKPTRLTGNQLGALLLDYLIHIKKPKGKWAVATTIVSSSLIRRITAAHGGTCFELLTGFKYIGEKIHLWEGDKNGYQFFFGMEESLGYLHGTHSRDKDGTIAACLTADMTLRLKKEKKTLFAHLCDLYKEYGIHVDDQLSIEAPGGLEEMTAKLDKLRKAYPYSICNIPVKGVQDYLTSSGGLPKSNILAFHLEDQSRFILRPSGTEPKLKIYGEIYATTRYPSIEEGLRILSEKLHTMLAQIKTDYFS